MHCQEIMPSVLQQAVIPLNQVQVTMSLYVYLFYYLLTFLNLKKKTQNWVESTEPEGTDYLFWKQQISISSHRAPMRY